MKFHVVIPARWASSRLPGKPLADLAGRPLLAWVWQVANESGADQVIIATDDERIETAAKRFGARVVMTRVDHPSGTDRINEVARTRSWPDDSIVVNLQGDEPLLPPQLVAQVATALAADEDAGIATLATPVMSIEEAHDSNVVKVVCDREGRASYFSRAPIPFQWESSGQLHDGMLRHIGLYAYRVGALRTLAELDPAPTELVERLEQLRALWYGIPIVVARAVDAPPQGVDTAEDLERVRELVGANQ
jgi:3-deoxy-manno-octulosonate cytidylyltransferase (CMP-KDO synthetase)